jgi:RNA polymerase sigma factor for flagellar operon FliA
MRGDEVELWERQRQGDASAREALILYYLPLVKVWVSRVSRIAYWANREDLMQEGLIGLMEAIEKFSDAGCREFRPYAGKFIQGAMLRNTEVTRDLARRQYENYRKVKNAYSALMQRHEREPAFEEVVEETGLTVEQVRNALDATHIAFAEAFADSPPEPAPAESPAESQDEIIMIREALGRLTEKQVLILTEHYWAGHSDAEIAKRHAMKEETVTKTRKRAIIKLRKLLEVEEGGEHYEY